MYYATKDNVTKEIPKHDAEYMQMLGWEITASPDENYNPYIYGMAKEKGNCLEPIIINGERFDGYSDFYCINTKTYVEEPSRTLDGSIPNINDYDTFIVPRVQISFKYMTIQDFRRLLKAITPNEFNVSYYDYETDNYVTYKMYCEPREMAKIFNKGYEILAVTEQKVSLIGTLNDMEYLTIMYFDTIEQKEYTQLSKSNLVFGNYYTIKEIPEELQKQGYKFEGWNTKFNGDGTKYLENEVFQATKHLRLYSQWKKE